MGNKIKREITKIEIPKGLRDRSVKGVQKAKSEIPNRSWPKWIALAASLFILFGGYGIYKKDFQENSNSPVSGNNSSTDTLGQGLHIPAMKLPENSSNNETADMIGLIVYNGKIYTQTTTEIDLTRAKDLVGEKIGKTKGNINEWSKRDAYAVKLASTIGEIDVFTVKGYDEGFRIMSYSDYDGRVVAEFYECLNGVTIKDGEDVFGKLKLAGNIENVKYRSYDDWYNSVDNYYSVHDLNLLTTFVDELNNSVPLRRENIEGSLGDFRNNEMYKILYLYLDDGSKVSLNVIKGGYIHYGDPDLYFKMESDVFTELWELLG